MKITHVRAKGFMVHDDFELELPTTGVVLVSGPNGSGKSSVAEMVAWGIWGETLRGSVPYRDGEACFDAVETDGPTVHRERTEGGKNKLSWILHPDAQPLVYENAQKAQEALLAHAGSFEVWRHSHYFGPSSDAVLLTQAKDSERKRLLEQILDLGRFDRAHKRCREAFSKAVEAVSTLEHGISYLEQTQTSAEQRIQDAEQQLELMGKMPDIEALKKKLAKLDELRKGLKATIAEVQSAPLPSLEIDDEGVRLAREEHVQVKTKLDSLIRQTAKLKEGGKAAACPTCKRPFTSDPEAQAHRERELKRLLAETQALDEELASIAKAGAAAKAGVEKQRKEQQDLRTAAEARRNAELEEVQESLENLTGKRGACAKELEEVERKLVQQHKLREVLEQAREAAQDARGKAEAARERLASLRKEKAVLEAAERVLGLKGVRSAILSDALSAIEAAANLQLAQLSPEREMTLALSTSREKKGGKDGSIEAITLEVHGVSGGQGYRGASTGERRRIDVAIMLAISDVAAASWGKGGGTLFIDEVLDGVDSDGVDAVLELLKEMAKERCVVLISHREDLMARLPGCRRVKLAGGKPAEKAA